MYAVHEWKIAHLRRGCELYGKGGEKRQHTHTHTHTHTNSSTAHADCFSFRSFTTSEVVLRRKNSISCKEQERWGKMMEVVRTKLAEKRDVVGAGRRVSPEWNLSNLCRDRLLKAKIQVHNIIWASVLMWKKGNKRRGYSRKTRRLKIGKKSIWKVCLLGRKTCWLVQSSGMYELTQGCMKALAAYREQKPSGYGLDTCKTE